MNRKERRAAKKGKRITYERVALPAHLDELIIFSDWERVLEKLEHEQIEYKVKEDGTEVPVMLSSRGVWEEVVPAMRGWILSWIGFNERFNLNHDVTPLDTICRALYYNKMLTHEQVMAAKQCLLEERKLFRQIDRDELASAARTEQIKMYL